MTGYQTKQRKLLEPVDHGKIEYEPFRKNFYVEVPELAKMSQEGKMFLFVWLCYGGLWEGVFYSAGVACIGLGAGRCFRSIFKKGKTIESHSCS